VKQDPTDLCGISDDGEHLHGGAAAAALQGVHLVDLSQQPCPSRARLFGRDGLIRAAPGGAVDSDGKVLSVLPDPSLGRATAPPLGSQAYEVGLPVPTTGYASLLLGQSNGLSLSAPRPADA
jgi:hypothetical protein